jgi:hypothetical protein
VAISENEILNAEQYPVTTDPMPKIVLNFQFRYWDLFEISCLGFRVSPLVLEIGESWLVGGDNDGKQEKSRPHFTLRKIESSPVYLDI